MILGFPAWEGDGAWAKVFCQVFAIDSPRLSPKVFNPSLNDLTKESVNSLFKACIRSSDLDENFSNRVSTTSVKSTAIGCVVVMTEDEEVYEMRDSP